jgi:very-short-patch-repair endonuclease
VNETDIVDMYVNQGLSTYVIAEKFATYPNKIRRILKKFGIELKDKSEAQKTAIKEGRSKHPTLGTHRDDAVKLKISEGVYDSWQSISSEERKKRIDKSKVQWYNMTEEERKSLQQAAAVAVRQAAKDGSKMEIFLWNELTRAGYDVLFHKTGLIPNDSLEVDLFLPAINTAIEVDGPAHFSPIWGEESLQKHVRSDAHKSGLLLMSGFVIIRVKHTTKNLSEKNKRDVLENLIVELNKIKNKFPSKNKRYIELEVQ